MNGMRFIRLGASIALFITKLPNLFGSKRELIPLTLRATVSERIYSVKSLQIFHFSICTFDAGQ